jgi:hypothetical protein
MMINKDSVKDLTTTIVRPTPDTIQINAWIGDLYLGSRVYKKTSMKKALRMATDYIRINGSLH